MSEDKNQPDITERYKIHVYSQGMSEAVMQDIVRMIKRIQQIEATVCPECGAKYMHGIEIKNNHLVYERFFRPILASFYNFLFKRAEHKTYRLKFCCRSKKLF